MRESPVKVSVSRILRIVNVVAVRLADVVWCGSETNDRLLQVPQLIAPLGQDSKSVLDKSDDDKEPRECGDIRLDRLGVGLHHVLHPATESLDPTEEIALALIEAVTRSTGAWSTTDRVRHVGLHRGRTIPRDLVRVDVNPLLSHVVEKRYVRERRLSAGVVECERLRC